MTASTTSRPDFRRARVRDTVRAIGKAAQSAVIATAVIVALWVFALWALDVPTFVGKGPIDVANWLFTVPAAEQNRALVVGQLGQTLADAAIGFCAGLGAALVLAALFLVFRPVEQALMPIALLLQSVPLIAIAPIIILVFGREGTTVAVMGGLVVLFPALVTIVFGLRSASPVMIDLVHVYGGGGFEVLRRVSLPSSVPALFAAIRVSVPGALTGALIAEWLATGEGIGRGIVSAIGQARMSEVWALTVVVTAVSIALYMVVTLVEASVVTRLGMRRTET